MLFVYLSVYIQSSPPLFWFFFGLFFFKALDLRDFRGISKNKKCGKGRGGCGGQQDSFQGIKGEGFLVFF